MIEPERYLVIDAVGLLDSDEDGWAAMSSTPMYAAGP